MFIHLVGTGIGSVIKDTTELRLPELVHRLPVHGLVPPSVVQPVLLRPLLTVFRFNNRLRWIPGAILVDRVISVVLLRWFAVRPRVRLPVPFQPALRVIVREEDIIASVEKIREGLTF